MYIILHNIHYNTIISTYIKLLLSSSSTDHLAINITSIRSFLLRLRLLNSFAKSLAPTLLCQRARLSCRSFSSPQQLLGDKGGKNVPPRQTMSDSLFLRVSPPSRFVGQVREVWPDRYFIRHQNPLLISRFGHSVFPLSSPPVKI